MDVKLKKYYLVVIVILICIFNVLIYKFFSKQLETYVVDSMSESDAISTVTP